MMNEIEQHNVFGEEILPCCFDPITGYFRTGYCETDQDDHGSHTICCVMTVEFLEFSLLQGNDLITPMEEYDFDGLKPGDCWCLCAQRWLEAHQANQAPRVKLRSTHIRALEIVDLVTLKPYAIDLC